MAINKSEGFRGHLPSYDIISSDTWESGQMASFADDGTGQMVVRPSVAAATAAELTSGAPNTTHRRYIGVFWGDKIDKTTEVVFEEAVSFNVGVDSVGDLDNNGQIFPLKHDDIVASSWRATRNGVALTGEAGTVGGSEPTDWGAVDYRIDITAGRIALNELVGPNALPALSTILVSYRYRLSAEELNRLSEFGHIEARFPDSTLGSNKATILLAPAIFQTDQYDTGLTYSIGSQLRIDANGRWTTATAGSGDLLGRVFKAPTASNRFITIDMSFALSQLSA